MRLRVTKLPNNITAAIQRAPSTSGKTVANKDYVIKGLVYRDLKSNKLNTVNLQDMFADTAADMIENNLDVGEAQRPTNLLNQPTVRDIYNKGQKDVAYAHEIKTGNLAGAQLVEVTDDSLSRHFTNRSGKLYALAVKPGSVLDKRIGEDNIVRNMADLALLRKGVPLTTSTEKLIEEPVKELTNTSHVKAKPIRDALRLDKAKRIVLIPEAFRDVLGSARAMDATEENLLHLTDIDEVILQRQIENPKITQNIEKHLGEGVLDGLQVNTTQSKLPELLNFAEHNTNNVELIKVRDGYLGFLGKAQDTENIAYFIPENGLVTDNVLTADGKSARAITIAKYNPLNSPVPIPKTISREATTAAKTLANLMQETTGIELLKDFIQSGYKKSILNIPQADLDNIATILQSNDGILAKDILKTPPIINVNKSIMDMTVDEQRATYEYRKVREKLARTFTKIAKDPAKVQWLFEQTSKHHIENAKRNYGALLDDIIEGVPYRNAASKLGVSEKIYNLILNRKDIQEAIAYHINNQTTANLPDIETFVKNFRLNKIYVGQALKKIPEQVAQKSKQDYNFRTNKKFENLKKQTTDKAVQNELEKQKQFLIGHSQVGKDYGDEISKNIEKQRNNLLRRLDNSEGSIDYYLQQKNLYSGESNPSINTDGYSETYEKNFERESKKLERQLEHAENQAANEARRAGQEAAKKDAAKTTGDRIRNVLRQTRLPQFETLKKPGTILMSFQSAPNEYFKLLKQLEQQNGTLVNKAIDLKSGVERSIQGKTIYPREVLLTQNGGKIGRAFYVYPIGNSVFIREVDLNVLKRALKQMGNDLNISMYFNIMQPEMRPLKSATQRNILRQITNYTKPAAKATEQAVKKTIADSGFVKMLDKVLPKGAKLSSLPPHMIWAALGLTATGIGALGYWQYQRVKDQIKNMEARGVPTGEIVKTLHKEFNKDYNNGMPQELYRANKKTLQKHLPQVANQFPDLPKIQDPEHQMLLPDAAYKAMDLINLGKKR